MADEKLKACEKRELLCEACGRQHRHWTAASPLWNAVIRGGSINGDEDHAFLCADCFMSLAEDRGIANLFRLTAERALVPLETVTPSGRTWNDFAFCYDSPEATRTDDNLKLLREALSEARPYVERYGQQNAETGTKLQADIVRTLSKIAAALAGKPSASDDELTAEALALKKAVAERMGPDYADGFWRECSGCFEAGECGGLAHLYPFSNIFNCQLGGGCSECGGIGAIWDSTDYDAMARDMIETDRAALTSISDTAND